MTSAWRWRLPPTSGPRRERRWDRSTDCRLRSRTCSRRWGFRLRADPRSTATRCRPRTRCWWSGCVRPAPFPSARPTRPNSEWVPTRTTRCTARRSIRTTRPRVPAARAAARVPRSQAGMLPIADGSDMGGSLRNPGNFNNVVGMRPTVGLVPTAPTALPFVGFAVNGPMARTVSDTAWLLSVMAGPDPRDPAACRPTLPHFARLWVAASEARVSPGARTSADFRSTRGCARCCQRNARRSKRSAAWSRTSPRIWPARTPSS